MPAIIPKAFGFEKKAFEKANFVVPDVEEVEDFADDIDIDHHRTDHLINTSAGNQS